MRSALASTLIVLTLTSASSFAERGGKRKVITFPELDQLSASLAKPTSDELNTQIATLKNQNALSLAAVNASKAEVAKLNPKISQLAKDIEEQTKVVESKDGRFLFFGSKSADMKKAEAKLAELEAQKAEIEETLTAYQSKIGNSMGQLAEQTKSLNEKSAKKDALPGEVAEEVKRLQKALLAQGIQANLSDALGAVNSKLLDVHGLDTKMQILERAYDNQVLGAYVREKMDRLVNSQAFCDAKDNCGKEGNAKKKINVDGLFHNESGNLGQKRGGGVSEDTH